MQNGTGRITARRRAVAWAYKQEHVDARVNRGAYMCNSKILKFTMQFALQAPVLALPDLSR